jgi:hypothetical protein
VYANFQQADAPQDPRRRRGRGRRGRRQRRDVSAYPSLDALKVEAPKGAFGGTLEGKRVAPLLLSQEGSGTGRVRAVQPSNSAYQFGGARNDNAPNVVDLVTPDGVTQSAALAYTATERATIPYVEL